MKPSDKLFLLIKSLTPAEKRYFKRVASLHALKGKNNYVDLFEAVDRQTEYDEGQLKRVFSDAAFSRNLHVAKGYLYRIVRKSLLNYHAASTVEGEIRDSLRFMEILYEKGLNGQCEQELEQAKELGLRYEKHLLLADLAGWEQDLLKTRPDQGGSEEKVAKIYHDLYENLELHRNQMEYNHFISKIFFRRKKKGLTRSEMDFTEHNYPGSGKLFGSEKKARSFRAKYNYFTCMFTQHFIRNEYAKALHYSRKQVNLLEAHPHQIGDRPRSYFSALSNLMLCQLNMQHYDDIPESIAKLKKLRTRSAALNEEIYLSAHLQELDLFIDTGDFPDAEKTALQIDRRLEEHALGALKKWDEVHLRYSMAYGFFGSGNYPMAKKYIQRVISDPAGSSRSDLQGFARILNLVLHIELGDEDLLEHIVRSTYRYLYKRNRLYRFETSVMRFIRKKLPGLRGEEQLLKAFSGLKKELQAIVRDPYERTALSYFDFIAWLESKVEGKKFAEVMKSKAMKKKESYS